MKNILFTIILFSFSLSSFAQQQYTVDTQKSTLNWESKKIVGSGNKGAIKLAKGKLSLKNNLLSGGEFSIDMQSITDEKGSERLVEHLKNDDFFSVSKYPTATFVITEVKNNGNNAQITGNLSIKGITKKISFPALITYNKDSIHAIAKEVKVDRTLYDIRYRSSAFFSDLGDKAIENIFTLTIDLTAKK